METTIPVTINSEAAERIAELGIEREIQQMLDHTKQTVPGVRAIEVELQYDPCEPGFPVIVIISYRPNPGPGDDPTNRKWGEWYVDTFPPDAHRRIVMLSCYEEPDAR
jgi:hypothetical protein